MPFNPETHRRQSIRLKHYDYSKAGFYFITLCIQNKESLFGKILDDQMILNAAGQMIEREWLALKKRFPHIELHEYVVMPNHFHAIIEIRDYLIVIQQKGRPQGYAPTSEPTNKTIGEIVGAFKSITTIKYILGVKTLHWQGFDCKLWQRNYWEHVIRNEQSRSEIAQYIITNPQKWEIDQLRPIG